MATTAKARTYCISLDDDPMIFKIIQEITKLPTLPFVSGEKLRERASAYLPLVAFVDIHLGDDESGLTVLPALRLAWPHTPIIVMTSDGATTLIGEALSLGANDFIRKPLDPDEVRARVQARTFEMRQREMGNSIQLSDITMDRGRRSLEGPLGLRFLSESEWQLLACLVDVRSMVVPKQELKGKVWGDVRVTDNAVDRKLSAVRQALRDVSERVKLSTVYGKGVSIEVEDRQREETP